MARITYRRGPLGYAVLLDGKPAGSIKDRRNYGVWQVDVAGLNSALAVAQGPFRGATTFPKLRDAKAAVSRALLGA